MNRREVLVAASAGVLAVSCGGRVLARGGSHGPVDGPGLSLAPNSGQCAFLPIEWHTRADPGETMAVHLRHFWADQTASPARLSRWDVDFTLVDDAGVSRIIHAWQLRRQGQGPDLAASPLRMVFPGGVVLSARTLSQRGGGTAPLGWSQVLPSPGLVVLASARSSTAAPPQLQELRYIAKDRELALANGTPRDFDALLVEIC